MKDVSIETECSRKKEKGPIVPGSFLFLPPSDDVLVSAEWPDLGKAVSWSEGGASGTFCRAGVVSGVLPFVGLWYCLVGARLSGRFAYRLDC